MLVDEHRVAEVLTFDGDESSSGENCKFIDLENGWGLKCFLDKDSRDVAYTCQKYMASKKLGPEVGKKFQLVDHDGNSWHCHVTEVVETVIPYGYENSHSFNADIEEDIEGNGLDWDIWEDERETALDEIFSITNHEYTDFHIGNWGYKEFNGEKKLIVIDFDLWGKLFKSINEGTAP